MTTTSTASRIPRMPYMPALDGIRGAAMLAIFGFHAEGLKIVSGAYGAVSTFFTLSGFLITSLMIAEYEANREIALGAFWVRRFRRLLPASWFTLAFIAGPYSWWFASGAQLTKIPGDVLASLGQVVNWRFIFEERAYFEISGRSSPLHHFWTLAIEEQFYLAFPLLIFLVYRGARRRQHTLLALSTLMSISFLLGMFVFDGDRRYFGTDTRAGELLIGGVLALLLRTPHILERPLHRKLAAWVGALVGIGVLTAWITMPRDPNELGNGYMAIYSTGSCLLILGAMQPGPLRWILSTRPMVFIGTISYGMYLFHVPIIQILNRDLISGSPWLRLGIQLLATILFAWISAQLLELPIRKGLWLRRKWSIALATPAAIASVIVLAVTSTTINTAKPQSFEQGKSALTSTVAPKPTRVLLIGDAPTSPIFSEAKKFRVSSAPASPCGIARDGNVPGDPVDNVSIRMRGDECVSWWQSIQEQINTELPEVVIAFPFQRDLLDRKLPEQPQANSLVDPVLQEWFAAELEAAKDVLTSRGAAVIWVPLRDTQPTLGPRAAAYDSLITNAATAPSVIAMEPTFDSVTLNVANSRTKRSEVTTDIAPLDPNTIPGAPQLPPIPVTGKVRMAMFGDSVAYGLAYGLELWSNSAEGSGAKTNNWGRFHCPIARGGKIRFESAEELFDPSCDWATNAVPTVSEVNPNVIFIMSGTWDVTDRLLPGDTKWRHPGDPIFDNYFIREATSLVDALGRQGARVVILTHHHIEAGRTLGFENLPESDPKRIDRLNEMYRLIAASRSNFVQVIEFGDWIQSLPRGGQSTTYLADGIHIRDEMSYEIAKWLGPAGVAISSGTSFSIPDPAKQPDPGPLPSK